MRCLNKKMYLTRLLSLLERAPIYQQLAAQLYSGQGPQNASVPEGAQPFVLAALSRHAGHPVLVVASAAEEALRLYVDLMNWLPDKEIVLFPEPDTLPYEAIRPDSYIMQQRLQTLDRLVNLNAGDDGCRQEYPVIVATAAAVVRQTASRRRFEDCSHDVVLGADIPLADLPVRWDAMGYRREPQVEVPGTMTQRGGIIDVYPVNSELPARIEFFGNEVSSIRLFDPRSQRSVKMVDSIHIPMAGEIDAPEADITDGHALSTIVDYLPEDSVVVLVEPAEVETALVELDDQAAQLRRWEGLDEAGPQGDNDFRRAPYLTWLELEARLECFCRRVSVTRWPVADPSGKVFELPFAPASGYSGQIGLFVSETGKMLEEGCSVVIVSRQATRLFHLLEEAGLTPLSFGPGSEAPTGGDLYVSDGYLNQGWNMNGSRKMFPGTGDKLVLLTDREIFGFGKKPRVRRPRPVQQSNIVLELEPGDYAVHVDHGIGKFTGMTVMGRDGQEREYLTLQYASADRLYVPTEQADRVSRYLGSGEAEPSLTRLGTHEWDRIKKRVRESAREMAGELLELNAAREVAPGIVFSADTPWQQEMEGSFPYEETPDQAEVLERVKRDMEQARPMDRVVCGDVGYGKTEVALRAAFKAVMDGRQVALLVPTTVLAQQHYNTFRERLAAFPVKVEMLSRFRSEKEQRDIVRALVAGGVDICIGTHRILQADVAFKDLGLVIIDEEQRFGVGHKERLKKLRTEVDVLTLSATPIPRTLYMALVGVRDMSVMETPPEDRLPIKSAVSEYDESMVREAIIREMERGGQVFFVHNRVHNIHYVAGRIEKLVPEARVRVAHGQMSEDRLETAMLEFVQGRVDVLVCTTIIESGLDIANANTLIVNDADKLGLGQLYQLRGRVGRGHNRAYAYFMYSKGRRLSQAAVRRLEAIFEATELGAGFRIALKDLEIRGAGNLLGAEQSGHIAAVGFDLYCQLLAQAVNEAKDGQAAVGVLTEAFKDQPSLDLPLAAHLPEKYIADSSVRLSIYQRLARLNSEEEVDGMERELEDRFGGLPAEAQALLFMAGLRVLASRAGVQSVGTDGRFVLVQMRQGARFDRQALGRFGRRLRLGNTQLRLDMTGMGDGWQETLRDVFRVLTKSTDTGRDGDAGPRNSARGIHAG